MNLIESIFNHRTNTSNQTIKKYLSKLNLKNNFKIINVVGTNGKGSVTNYLSYSLSYKYKVGAFTSPHIFEANERIKINNQNIATSELNKYIIKYINTNLHFFAIMFLSAIEYFNDQKCEIIILEAGIGGTYDPSNILDGNIGVITSVGYDHMELFGKTLNDVLNDKIGIINKGMNFYSGTELKNMNNIIQKYCLKVQANHFLIKNEANDYKNRNKKLVQAILKEEFNLKPNFIEPLGRTTIQLINNKKAIIDVAHNEDGIKATLQLLKENKIFFDQVVITMSKRKTHNKLKEIFSEKEMFVYQLDKTFISHKDLNAHNVENLKKFYNNQSKNTLYIGSFYSIGEILNNDK